MGYAMAGKRPSPAPRTPTLAGAATRGKSRVRAPSQDGICVYLFVQICRSLDTDCLTLKVRSVCAGAAIAAAGRACSLPDDAVSACQAFADQVAKSERLTMIGRHLHAKIFPDGEGSLASGAELSEFPSEIDGLGAATATLYLLLYLTGVPALLAHHRERCIPEDVSRSTLSDIAIWVRAHTTGSMSPVVSDSQAQSRGVVGLSNLAWPMHSLNGNILRVGRFQHRRGKFNAPFEVYRHSQSRAVQMVVSESGIGFGVDGLLARIPTKPISKVVREARKKAGCPVTAEEDAASVPEPAWRSEYNYKILVAGDLDASDAPDGQPGRAVLRATPVLPTGYGSRDSIELDLGDVVKSGDDWEQVDDQPLVVAGACAARWELVLERGSPILEIHIPEGSAISVEACADGTEQLMPPV